MTELRQLVQTYIISPSSLFFSKVNVKYRSIIKTRIPNRHKKLKEDFIKFKLSFSTFFFGMSVAGVCNFV